MHAIDLLDWKLYLRDTIEFRPLIKESELDFISLYILQQ